MEELKKIFFGLFLLMSTCFALEMSLAPKVLFQGECSRVSITSLEDLSQAKIIFREKKYPLYRHNSQNYVAIIPTDFNVPAGEYSVSLMITNQSSSSKKLLVKEKFFRKSVVRISKEKKKQGVTDRSALWGENKILGKAYRTQSVKKFWQEKFLVPVKSYLRISTPYGARRDYKYAESEEIVRQWRHKGIDFSAYLGTPVFAPCSGKVLVSKSMQVHGKTIVIDHGQGVVSIFNHLSQRFVHPRQFVKKGQCIGRVGNTGLSTGSHLHYGLSVNNVRVDPNQWFVHNFD